jgi:hypothetical protein
MSPERWLKAALHCMPKDRAEWGEAMMAELPQVESKERWRFALSCTRVALFPPAKGEQGGMAKGLLFTLLIAVFGAFLLWRPETGGTWLAQAISFHSWVVLASKVSFIDMLVLAALIWSLVKRARGREPWSKVPVAVQQSGRLAAEVYFGLLNPVLYLAILTSGPGMLRLRTDSALGGWIGPLHTGAAGLLVAVWGWRLYGSAFRPGSQAARGVLRMLLWASIACLMLFALKDLNLLTPEDGSYPPWKHPLIAVFVMGPMYLIPGVLLYDYLREASKTPDGSPPGFFLLKGGTSRAAIAALVGVSILTFAFATRRRTDSDVRELVTRHRAAIRAAAARYDTDPRLIGAIVYVTHRDQLSPFRDSIERIFSTAWIVGLPDRYLNRALDLSLGLAQIKPTTAQTGAVLAVGGPEAFKRAGVLLIERVGEGIFEPLGAGWGPRISERIDLSPPIPVYADRAQIVAALQTPAKNLETCAFLLALYQRQWENANPAWSIRERPDILATLYQIGFARSKPHGAPRSNAFGARVREVYEQPWLSEFAAARK